MTISVSLQGVLSNLAAVSSGYGPEWVVRVYHDLDDASALCGLACAHPQLDLCPARELPMLGDVAYIFPMVWRFLPGLDPQVT